jgi:hypothetical protein
MNISSQEMYPVQINLLIHLLNLPTEVKKKIAEYAITLLDCKICKRVILKDSTRKTNIAWCTDNICIRCENEKNNLQRLYSDYLIRKLDNNSSKKICDR